MRHAALALAGAALVGVAATIGLAYQDEAAPAPEPDAAIPATAEGATNITAAAPAKKPRASGPALPATRAVSRDETAMDERVAVLGVLNKRNGIWRDVTLKPGQAIRLNDVIVRLRACETTADWEPEQLTGAFVQMDVRARDGTWGRAFSGWLYKETPSLNVVEHPIYDVWPKSCAMTHPDIGPDTVSAASAVPAKRSSAPKSTEPAAAGSAQTPTPPAANAAPSIPR